jgi:hypothetical protein
MAPNLTEPSFHTPGQNDIAYNMRLVLDTDVVLSGLRSTVGAFLARNSGYCRNIRNPGPRCRLLLRSHHHWKWHIRGYRGDWRLPA